MLRTAMLLIAGIVSTSAPQASDPASEAARSQDVYAVYSALMSNPPVIGGESNSTYAIAAATTPANLGRGIEPAAQPATEDELLEYLKALCDAPPPGYEEQWQEILAEFRSRSDAPVPLVPNLKIAKPYIFLTAEEIADFTSRRTSVNIPPVPIAKFGGAISVIRLSNVYFNKTRTLAFVRISSECGMLCGKGQGKMFEKVGAGWREVNVTGGRVCIVNS